MSGGRPTKWTEYEYYRLSEFVSYYRWELDKPLSLRRACQLISEREPWHSSGLSAETLRRRYSKACKLRAEGKIGKEWDSMLNFNFALTGADLRAMMTFRYRNAMEEWHRASLTAI